MPKPIPYLVLIELSDESTVPTEEDLLNSIDLPDCYNVLSYTCIASEGEIVQWMTT